MSKVKLAIRVRPFTERELKSDAAREPVVRVEDEHTLSITNLKVASSGAGDSRLRVRRYHADYCLDSSCAADQPSYASQEKVFSTVGREVLKTVLGGRSTCVLAYGQSATGKTHSMLGTVAEPGLVPRLCRELAAPAQERHITVSFLEIYNERVRDLLCAAPEGAEQLAEPALLGCGSLPRRRGNTFKDLRVREHPTRGPYVQNLRRVVVRDPEQLCALVWAGVERRRAAATRRNPVSSRSHALLQLSTGSATLLLADLAGSEKAGLEGAYRSRQKEGANINKSLVALSNVISALVRVGGCGGGGGGRGRYVPYRDSALTWLLKDCFTGGAATFILATVSASSACYSESASTLRWAAAARQLTAAAAARPGQPTAGVQAHTSTALLQRQLDTLRAALIENHMRFIPETGIIEPDLKYWDRKTKLDQENIRLNTTNIAEGMISLNITNSLDTIPYGSNESSITSTSSDRLEEKNLKGDKTANEDMYSPVLERAVSGHDLKVAVPHLKQKRQYRSHEVLPSISKHILNNPNDSPNLKSVITNISKQENERMETLSIKSDEYDRPTVPKSHVPFAMENPRAEIVASVTERLYNKLKKKEKSAKSKVENVVEKKIMEPLHELKICTNARQHLVEMSQRALRSRKKIGIAAHTQTQASIIRVKDQAIDSQSDLEPLCIQLNNTKKYCCNVYTETEPFTPRCREISTGPATGSLHKQDTSTITEDHYVASKSCSIMTEDIYKTETSTQTTMVPPPRKKKNSAFTKYLAPGSAMESQLPRRESNATSIINISISQTHPPESESLSDDSLEIDANNASPISNMPPDLLSNHNSIDQDTQSSPLVLNASAVIKNSNSGSAHESNIVILRSMESQQETINTNLVNQYFPKKSTDIMTTTNQLNKPVFPNDIFSDNDEQTSLPRTKGNATMDVKNIEDIILGRNLSAHPYNLTLLPNIERINSCKKSVKFEKDITRKTLVSVSTQTLYPSKWIDKEIASCDSTSSIHCTDISKTITLNSNTFGNTLSTGKDYRPVQSANSSAIRCTRSDLSLSNLTNSTLYKPTYVKRSPSCERTTRMTPPSTYERFLFHDDKVPYGCASLPHSSLNDQASSSCCSPNNWQSVDTSDSETDLKSKIKFFEFESRRNRDRWPKYEKGFNYCYGDEERKMRASCRYLEKSIEKHEAYIRRLDSRRRRPGGRVETAGSRPPSEYFQQLLQERRNVVNEATLKGLTTPDCIEFSKGVSETTFYYF